MVLDTNVFSEALKPSPSAAVITWLKARERSSVFITAISMAESLHGVEAMSEGRRRANLQRMIEETFAEYYVGRILPFDDSAARLYAKIVAGRAAAGRPISQSDAMIAAIARSHQFAVATRDVADFEHCGIRVINPWAPGS